MAGKKSPEQRGFLAEWAVTLVILLFGMTALAQAFVIPTGSMEGTLLVGDHVIVDRLAYAPPGSMTRHVLPYEDLQRGDIIVFRYPLDLNRTLVKRAMGLPGDRIRMENKVVYLNGHRLDEPYAVYRTNFIYPYRDTFPAGFWPDLRPEAAAMLATNVRNGELVVPPGFVFAMGDNRDESDDSRFWGLVPRRNIVGKPVLVYWSYDAPSEELTDPSVNLRHIVDIAVHFPTKTRWNRTLRLVRGYPVQ